MATAQELERRGIDALRRGDFAGAREALSEATAGPGAGVSAWVNLALASRGVGDEAGEGAALDRALALDPRLLPALLLKGQWWERRGEARRAGQTFGHALSVAPPFETLPPDLRGAVRHAHQAHQTYQADYERHLRKVLAPSIEAATGERLARVEESIDVFLGKKAIYRQQPEGYYFPGLPTVQFFEREDFPWLAPIEAETDAIRAEFLDILAADQGFEPYVNYGEGTPLDEWAGLNKSPSWSAYHLKTNGAVVADHAAACPMTMAAIANAPQPSLPGRSPAAFFSLLKPRTHIPPHVGVTNVRLVVHIPLIVPPACSFRCGNAWREWEVGKALIFDDTIEHEAKNDSDQLRVVLIFDIWRPELTETEKRLLGEIMAGMDAFTGEAPGSAI